MKTIFKISAVTIMLAAVWMACENVEKTDPVPDIHPSNLTANFLFVNASPDAPALDFYVNNQLDTTVFSTGLVTYRNDTITTNGVGANTRFNVKAHVGSIGGVLVGSDLIYRSSNTGVGDFTASNGAYYTLIAVDTINRPKPLRTINKLTKFADNTYYSSLTQFVSDTIIPLSGNNSADVAIAIKNHNGGLLPSTFFSIGTVPLGSSDVGGPRFLLLTDSWTAPTPGKFSARFINASPDAGTASCKINAVTVGGSTSYPMSPANFNPSVGSRSATVSFTNNVTVPGSYAAGVTVGAITYNSPTIAFADGGVYTVVLTGSLAKGTLAVTVVRNK